MRLVSDTITAHKGSGIDGFMEAIKRILMLPRVQDIKINKKGEITYSRILHDEEPLNKVEVDFSTTTPSAIIRSVDITELPFKQFEEAPLVIARLIDAATKEHYIPFAFAVSSKTDLKLWIKSSLGFMFADNRVYGYPVFFDDALPEEALILMAAYTQTQSLLDVAICYKISMPKLSHQVDPNFPMSTPEKGSVQIQVPQL